jgi:uroporphyrin-3 C-methyltransferase
MLLALVALVAAGYSLFRSDRARDRLDALGDEFRATESARAGLRADLDRASSGADARLDDLAGRLDALESMTARLGALESSLHDLETRTDQPQRAWTRSEALFLVGSAQRRLDLERDVPTAVATLRSAELALADLREPRLDAVRAEIAHAVAILEQSPQPDRAALAARLATAAEHATDLALSGPVAEGSGADRGEGLPASGWRRAQALVKRAFSDLLVIRRTNEAGRIMSADAARAIRQHLELELFSARLAVARSDPESYRSSLLAARSWLDRYFDASQPEVTALGSELDALANVDIAPPLPDLAEIVRMLERATLAGDGDS